MLKFFNIRAATAERTRLEREIQKHEPDFALTPGPASFKIGNANAEIDDLREHLARVSGKMIRLSSPEGSPLFGAKKPAGTPAVKASNFPHVSDLSLRELLDRTHPNGLPKVAAKPPTPTKTAGEITFDKLNALKAAGKWGEACVFVHENNAALKTVPAFNNR